MVLTTVVEHHANLLPWGRVATRRYVECGADGTFEADDVIAGLEAAPSPAAGPHRRLQRHRLAARSCRPSWRRPTPGGFPSSSTPPNWPPTGPSRPASTTWPSPATRCTPPTATGVLVGPRATFAEGDPFLAGGGAVDLVDLDEVVWTEPPDREEAGSPNVVGAVALAAALDTLAGIGWDAIDGPRGGPGPPAPGRPGRHRRGHALLGPPLDTETLAIGTFTVEGMPHALVAARLSPSGPSASATAASAPTPI